MRVLLTTYGSRGDVEPMVALAVQLQELGADVRLCAPPDEELVALLAGAGVPHVPYDRPWRTWQRPSTPAEQVRRASEFIEAQYDTLAAAAKGCDGLLSTAMSIFVGRSAAEQAGIPHRYVAFAPNVVEDIRAQDWKAVFGEPINAHRSAIGLPEVADVGEYLFTHRPLLAADPTLGPLGETPGLDVAHTGAWILPDERPLPSDVEAFLAAGAPPVYVGFGSMRTTTEETGRAAIEAVRSQGRRVLLSRGWAGLALLDDRDDCFAVGEINQQALFGRVAAVVHHGGAGTTTTAARAGAPQVIVPQAGGDQPYWARRVAELGIGAAHDGPAPTVESLSAALEPALASQTRARAAAVADLVRTDGAAVAAKLLLEVFG